MPESKNLIARIWQFMCLHWIFLNGVAIYIVKLSLSVQTILYAGYMWSHCMRVGQVKTFHIFDVAPDTIQTLHNPSYHVYFSAQYLQSSAA